MKYLITALLLAVSASSYAQSFKGEYSGLPTETIMEFRGVEQFLGNSL